MFASLVPRELIVFTAIAGAGIVLAGLLALFGGEYLKRRRCAHQEVCTASAPVLHRGAERTPSRPSLQSIATGVGWWQLGLLLLIVAAGALLRLDGLDQKTMSHPEVYVPGIRLPDGISEPPPRLTIDEVIWWHFHDEPHPQGYYFLMWVWTQLLGTDLWRIRLPSVLFGLGSIVLTFLVASRSYGVTIGLISAALLSFNGFQIFWSQMARMYGMTCFLGLLSTLLLLQLVNRAEARTVREGLYVVVSLLGLFTEILFWPFLFAQSVWVVMQCRTPDKGLPRMLVLQALTAILGAPLWAHAVYRARTSPMDGSPSLFMAQFLSFGFLFENDTLSDPVRIIPLPVTLVLAALAALCLSSGLASRSSQMGPRRTVSGLATAQLVPIAIGILFVMFAETVIAHGRRWEMIVTTVVPVAVVLTLWALERSWPLAQRALDDLNTRVTLVRASSSLCAYLVFIPSILMLVISPMMYLLGQRLFLLFTPYVLILASIGIRSMSKRRTAAIALAVVMVSVHMFSIRYFKEYQSEIIDYSGLSKGIASRYTEGDAIFIRERDWVSTPVFYYLSEDDYRFVTHNFDDAVRTSPLSRVWIIHFAGYPPLPEMQSALTGFHLQEQVEARRAFGSLYTRR